MNQNFTKQYKWVAIHNVFYLIYTFIYIKNVKLKICQILSLNYTYLQLFAKTGYTSSFLEWICSHQYYRTNS